MTLREYIIFWQETYDKSQSRPTTYAAHHYVFKNHILPGLGDIPLAELTSEMVGDFLEERRHFGNHRPGSSGLGEETMRHIHRLLQQCMDQAMRDGLLTENPAKAFRYRKSTTVKANNEIIKEAGLDRIRFTDLRHTCAVLSLWNGMETKELARMLGHYRPSITRQNYEPYLPHKVQKDEDIPNEATQGELQQAANVLDTLLKF